MPERGPIALCGDQRPLADPDHPIALALGAARDVTSDRWMDLLPATTVAGEPAIRARVPADPQTDARRPDLIELVGDDSARFVRALNRTTVWSQVISAWRAGAAVVAGGGAAMAVGEFVGRVRGQAHPGLGLVRGLLLVPEADGLGPTARQVVLSSLAAPAITVVGLDRGAALLGTTVPADPATASTVYEFRSHGTGSAWVAGPQRPRRVLAPILLEVAP